MFLILFTDSRLMMLWNSRAVQSLTTKLTSAYGQNLQQDTALLDDTKDER